MRAGAPEPPPRRRQVAMIAIFAIDIGRSERISLRTTIATIRRAAYSLKAAPRLGRQADGGRQYDDVDDTARHNTSPSIRRAITGEQLSQRIIARALDFSFQYIPPAADAHFLFSATRPMPSAMYLIARARQSMSYMLLFSPLARARTRSLTT